MITDKIALRRIVGISRIKLIQINILENIRFAWMVLVLEI